MKHNKYTVLLLSPVEIIGCGIIGLFRGICDGYYNVLEAWRYYNETH